MKYEIIGIIGTLFIILAFYLKGETKIRIFDTIGASLFVVYGILINSLSVWILNTILIIINVYRLYKLNNQKKQGE